MSYERLMELTESPAYAMVEWREVIKEIDIELKNDNSIEKRDALLQMFKTTMDLAEGTIVPEDLETFKEARRKHYHLHIVSEVLVGEEVCVETLFAVTSREIAAGRMTEENNLRKIAVDGCAAPHLSRSELEEKAREPKVEEKQGLVGRVKGFFGR